jgi:dTDP-4-dehydrorhamnose reductase
MPAAPHILIVGADGLLGRSLADRLESEQRPVLRTSRRGGPAFLPLDLAQDVSQWRPPQPISAAFLCAAITSLEMCRSQPALSRAVNITATLALARTLAEQGAWVVFFSSNLVFDGSQPHQKGDSPLFPRTEYGRQKAQVETELKAICPRLCIVRFTKVLRAGAGLLCQWRDRLASGLSVHPLSDMVMAPVSLAFAVEALCRMLQNCSQGVIQISASRDVSYEQAARYIAARMHADESLIQPVRAAQASLALEHVPQHTTLDTTRLIQELGLQPPDQFTTVDIAVSA